jgi:N-acetylmuramoyl-L-alanine amidase
VEESKDPGQPREKRIIIDDLASYEEEIGVGRGMKRRRGFIEFVKNIFVGLLLIGIVIGSFWVSFLIGKRVLVPVKPLATAELLPIEESIPFEEEIEFPVVLATPEESFVSEVPSKKVEPKPEPLEKIRYYKVQAGLFETKTEAQALVRELKEKGFTSFIREVDSASRVQAGAFRTKDRAQVLVDQLKAKGFNSDIIYE